MGSIKGQHLANFTTKLNAELDTTNDTWIIYVDRSSNNKGGEVNSVLKGSMGTLLKQSCVLSLRPSIKKLNTK